MAKAMSLVGLDVHARETHAAVLVLDTGELSVSKLRMGPVGVVSFLEGLGSGVRAVYEAGPNGFGLARAARERGVEVRVVAPGLIPKGSGDRVKTDRRDAIRLARLLAAGELSFVFVPSVEDEHFRDLAPGRPSTVARRPATELWATGLGRPRPFLDCEPRRTPGLEVKPSNISLTPQSMRLDLPLVPPRQHPTNANHHTIKQRTPLTNTSPYQFGASMSPEQTEVPALGR
jgi:hypothetical protein